MFSCVMSGGLCGIESYPVRVEADISDGMPVFEMIGYLGSEVREAKERVRTALKNAGYYLPVQRLTINMAPGDIKKSGTGYDVPIAIAILMSMGMIAPNACDDILCIGELQLDGILSPVKGILPIVLMARKEGYKSCIVPRANADEAALVDDIAVYGIDNITELIDFLNGKIKLEAAKACQVSLAKSDENDLSRVNGQSLAKRGLEIACSGMHNMLMIGPPGAGKTMIAKCIPSIMPPLTKEESLEVSSIYSVAGLLKDGHELINQRPFVAPHHTITDTAMTGGGSYPRPGSISMAHRGVLFLDEMPEFSRYSLEALRQPLEDRRVTISRNRGIYTYPADFMLVAAMNPCPCGSYPDMNKCTCTSASIKKYMGKISKPLLDRIDICITVEKLKYKEIVNKTQNEDSKTVRKRVIKALDIQRKRFEKDGILFNSQMKQKQVNDYCRLGALEEKWMEQAVGKLDISARSYTRIMKVARTIADLDGCEDINSLHLSEAIQFNRSELL